MKVIPFVIVGQEHQVAVAHQSTVDKLLHAFNLQSGFEAVKVGRTIRVDGKIVSKNGLVTEDTSCIEVHGRA